MRLANKNMGIVVKTGILLYLLVNIIATFYYQFNNPIDGDIAMNALPSAVVADVRNDPFGLEILLHGKEYVGAGGYIAHITVHKYFRWLPAFFRHFISPLDSVYSSIGLFAMILKAAYLYLFCYYISRKRNIFNRHFLLAAILITPLFQIGGYSYSMGIQDPMVIVDFNYSYIIFTILLFFLPFFMSEYHDKQAVEGSTLWWLSLFGLYIGINGPLAGPLLCIVFSFMMAAIWLRNLKEAPEKTIIGKLWHAFLRIPRSYWLLGFVIIVASVYCRYLTQHNAQNLEKQISLIERYQRLLIGLGRLFLSKGFALLTGIVVINTGLLFARRKDGEARKILVLFAWIMLFVVLYTISLPMGGYRFYRPYIIQRDVYSPVTAILVLFFGLSSLYLLRVISLQYLHLYKICIGIPLLHLAYVSFYGMPNNSCERNAILKIANSKEKVVELDEQCTIMSWGKITDPALSKDITDLMIIWGISHDEKYFYQK